MRKFGRTYNGRHTLLIGCSGLVPRGGTVKKLRKPTMRMKMKIMRTKNLRIRVSTYLAVYDRAQCAIVNCPDQEEREGKDKKSEYCCCYNMGSMAIL
jgi:hypothetical protein